MDEESFQGLLSAAFTIQEHNERRKARQEEGEIEARPEPEPLPEVKAEVELELEDRPRAVCPHCGAPKAAEGPHCESCGQDEFRPGERLQRNWASMWLMSQEQGLWPDRTPEGPDATAVSRGAPLKNVPHVPTVRRPPAPGADDSTASNFLALPMTNEVTKKTTAPGTSGNLRDRMQDSAASGKSLLDELADELGLDIAALDRAASEDKSKAAPTDGNMNHDATYDETTDTLLRIVPQPDDSLREDLLREDSDLPLQPLQLQTEDSDPVEVTTSEDSEPTTSSLLQRLAHLRVTLRFHRADLYLGLAIFVAAMALLWPAATVPRHSALGPWERVLVKLGIAEAPAPAVHFRGDPAIQVWVDPHTALYYCPGEDSYGKTPDGRFSAQREAQLDRFEPASRSACE
jgi:hypothetical protein